MKNEFFYPSADGETDIHAIEWIPEGDIRAVLQISHGMVEYIERYDEFAEYLNRRGIYVVGQDHLGHGKSVKSNNDLGYFSKTHGNDYVIGDIARLRKITQGKYPQLPYFLLGHSMGSFLTRQYIQMQGEGLAGVILSGTGYQPGLLLNAGILLCRIQMKLHGDRYKSEIVHKMAFGSFNKRFAPGKTDVDWISRDEDNVNRYVADPLCTFRFTVNAYFHMFSGMRKLTKKEDLEQMPKNLPVVFLSGKMDPVGDFGKGVVKVWKQYKNLGMKDVRIRLYDDDRHEILNETDRQRVYQDIMKWIIRHTAV